MPNTWIGTRETGEVLRYYTEENTFLVFGPESSNTKPYKPKLQEVPWTL